MSDDPQIVWQYDNKQVPERILLEGEFLKDLSQDEIVEMSNRLTQGQGFNLKFRNKIHRILRK